MQNMDLKIFYFKREQNISERQTFIQTERLKYLLDKVCLYALALQV